MPRLNECTFLAEYTSKCTISSPHCSFFLSRRFFPTISASRASSSGSSPSSRTSSSSLFVSSNRRSFRDHKFVQHSDLFQCHSLIGSLTFELNDKHLERVDFHDLCLVETPISFHGHAHLARFPLLSHCQCQCSCVRIFPGKRRNFGSVSLSRFCSRLGFPSRHFFSSQPRGSSRSWKTGGSERNT